MVKRQRGPERSWRARRFRSDRTAGYTAIAVLALIGTLIVTVHVAAHGVLPGISDVGAWLSNTPQGSVVHVNGLAGEPDARVTIHGADGHPLQVVQDRGQVLVVDTVTGVVSRIDPAQLTVSQAVDTGTAGAQIVTGGGVAYLVDAEAGVVQQIDLAKLSAVGAPARLNKRLGPSGVDDRGTLWAPVPADGQLIPVAKGQAGTPVEVGHGGDSLALTIASGTPVVTNSTQATMTVVSRTGGTVTVNLPKATDAPPPAMLAPPSTDGALVPVVVAGAGQLVVVDTKKGESTSVTLADLKGDDLGAPTALGSRVYVPDNTTGRLIVYDSAGGQLLDQITVTGRPSKLQLFVKDNMLWVNDPDGPDAVTVDQAGKVHHVGKYDPRLPGGPLPTPSAQPTTSPSPSGSPSDLHAGDNTPPARTTTQETAPLNQNTRPAPNKATPPPVTQTTTATTPATTQTTTATTPATTQTTTTATTPATTPAATSSPPPPPQAPPTVSETGQAGSIEVMFTRVTSGGVTDYTLTGLPTGAQVDLTSIPASGSANRFTVTGLSCASEYTFGVSANYPSGALTTTASAAARPCVVPSAPQNLKFDTGAEQKIGVSWAAPANDGGAPVSYVVSWSGKNSPDLTATNYTITGLTNFQSYLVTVAAKNGAGASQPPASGSVELKHDPWPGNVWNPLYPLNVREQADTGSQSLKVFPPGSSDAVSVKCWVVGGMWSDPTGSPGPDNKWYRITAPVTGYIAAGYVKTAPNVWKGPCP